MFKKIKIKPFFIFDDKHPKKYMHGQRTKYNS